MGTDVVVILWWHGFADAWCSSNAPSETAINCVGSRAASSFVVLALMVALLWEDEVS